MSNNDNKEIWAVFAWIIESGIRCTKVIPLSWKEDEKCWYTDVHEGRVFELGEFWHEEFSHVTFSSEDKKEVETFYNGLAAGAGLFGLWMKISNSM